MIGVTRRTTLAGIAGAAGLALAPRLGRAADTPDPTVMRLDPRLDRIIAPSAVVETLASRYRWTEGPLWVPGENCLLFSDVPANIVYRWTRAGGVKAFLAPSGLQGPIPPSIREAGANGLALDRQGRLLLADSGSRALVRVDMKTKRRTVLADTFEGKRFNSPNDMTVAKSGAIYFTDPSYGLRGTENSPIRELDFSGVYLRAPDGKLTVIDRTRRWPNGIGLSPDERTLYLAMSDKDQPEVLAYSLDARGLPTGVRTFRDMRPEVAKGWPGMPDGMDVAPDGHLFASGPGGIHVITPTGDLLGIIGGTGKPIANACVGEGRALFLTANDRVCRLPLLMGN